VLLADHELGMIKRYEKPILLICCCRQEMAVTVLVGVVPVSVVPALLLTVGCAALIAAGNLLALAPATIAADTPPGTTLRTE
jgi:hypothetical protein